ncbi:MAG: aminotransferase class I/II-fold pyridoxal phosphate-dependent enzyme [bacterium]|nr:aminotransferase class I/II-fold pyridoxal phosphate-dependent enzyme [bacterium]
MSSKQFWNYWRSQLSAICLRSYADDPEGGIGLPIRRSTTYRFTEESLSKYSSGHGRDIWLYSRYGNPTVRAVERKLAALEQTEDAVVTASGMAAVSAVLFACAQPGERWFVSSELYGVTYALLEQDLRKIGVSIEYLTPHNPLEWQLAAESGKRPTLFYFETLSNPLARPAAVPELIEIAKSVEAVTVIDNTFATPYHCIPSSLGADFVIESGSKYLNGHSDVIAGVVAGTTEKITPVWKQMTRLGGCLDPNSAYLWDRGLQSFPLRIAAATANAEILSKQFLEHPEVETISYPGIQDTVPEWLAGGSGVFSLRLLGGDERAMRFLFRLKTIVAATSLGGTETLASMPSNTSHAALTETQRTAIGILPGTVRIACGTEDYQVLVHDIEQAIIESKE